MPHELANLHRIGVKFFLAGDAPALDRLVPVFHRWIQDRVVEGLLIDVADYSHVAKGPGVMLIGHEGNYSLDLGGAGPGVSYWRRRPIAGDLPQRLESICAIALRAARALAEEGDLGRAGCIRGDVIEIVANDRLAAPNEAGTEAAFRPALDGLLDRLYAGGACELCRDEDPRERFNMHVKAAAPADAATLLSRLS